MNHPVLAATPVEDRRRRCPCGAVAQQPYGLCRQCQATAVATRDHMDEPPRHSQLDTRRNRESPALCAGAVTASDHWQGDGELMLTVLILIVFAVFALVLIFSGPRTPPSTGLLPLSWGWSSACGGACAGRGG